MDGTSFREVAMSGRPKAELLLSESERAYSTPNRTLIPRQTEHGFHSKASADSTASRAGIPRLPEREFHA